jgi:membrane protein DedA with SNARE-associated domain
VARHLSALRLAAFALAATHGVRRRTFVAADALSALVSVPLVVSAGYLGAHHLSKVRSDIRTVELLILAAVVLAALVVFVVRHVRRPRESTETPRARREA